MKRLVLFLMLLIVPLNGIEVPASKRRTLLSSLDPTSIPQHLAYWRLFKGTNEATRALQEAWKLLQRADSSDPVVQLDLSTPAIDELIYLVNRPPDTNSFTLSEIELDLINELAAPLKNRQLKGNKCTTEEEILALPTKEIDLARALLISQTEGDLEKTRSYEAIFDLMALQVIAKLPHNPSPKEVVDTLNDFIFREMHFRFPPHSTFAEEIDLYTFIPSVVDSRRGVCLGVSILYLCLAQRIGIDLQIITPPGHIFVRYEDGDQVINIETTARGIHIPDEDYLSMDTKALQKREMKEVVGMAHMNHAALFWQQDEYEKAIKTYLIAQKYMPDDPLIKEFLAYNYLFVGENDRAFSLLQEIADETLPHQVKGHSIAKEILQNRCDKEGILAIYRSVDEQRSSLEKKLHEIESSLEKFPNFASGWFHLGVTWLQLHRNREGLEAFEKFHALDPTDPTAEYYLSLLYLERLNLPKAWQHYRIAAKIVADKQHHPKALKELRASLLTTLCE